MINKKQVCKNGLGFTLVELLVVISIIAMLLAVLVPALSKARERSKTVLGAANEKQMGLASAMYCQSNNDALVPERAYSVWPNPTDADTIIWAALLAPYINNSKGAKSLNQGGYWAESKDMDSTLAIFKCPAQKDRFNYTWYLRYGINPNYASQPYLNPPRLKKLISIKQPSMKLHICDSMDNVPVHQKLSSYTQKLRDNIKSQYGYGYPGMDVWPTEDGRGLGSYVYLVADRHNNGSNVLHLDGHVKGYKYDELMYKNGEASEIREAKIALWGYVLR